MALLTGALYSKKGYGRSSFFGEIGQQQVIDTTVSNERTDSKAPESVTSKEDPVKKSFTYGEDLAEKNAKSGDSNEVKVIWKKSVSLQGKGISKDFYTPKQEDATEHVETEQEITSEAVDPKKPKKRISSGTQQPAAKTPSKGTSLASSQKVATSSLAGKFSTRQQTRPGVKGKKPKPATGTAKEADSKENREESQEAKEEDFQTDEQNVDASDRPASQVFSPIYDMLT